MEEFKLDMDGTYMNVIRFGTGARVLTVIAGISLCGLEGMGAALEGAFNLFVEDYTVYVFDRKKTLPENYSTMEMAEDLYEALTRLGVDKTDIFGVSHGGMMAMCIAAEHPDFVNKLVIGSACAKVDDEHAGVMQKWIELAENNDVTGLNRNFCEKVYSASYYEKNRESFKAIENIGNDADCARFKLLCEAILSFDIRDRLKEIKCPVLVIGAAEDKVFGATSSVLLATKVDCALYIYRGYGHAVYDEAPDYRQRIFDFLK